MAFEVGDLLATTCIDVLNKDTWTALLERYVGNTLAVRRKARRQDWLTRLQQGYSACTVVVRTLQSVTSVVYRKTLSRYIKQTCRESTLDTGELFKRLVRDVVRHVPQLFGGARYAAGQDLLLGGHVEQRVLDLQATAGRRDVADHQVLGAHCLPVTEHNFAGLVRLADHVAFRNRRVVTGVAQVVTDDLGHVVRQHATALPAERYYGNRGGPIATAGNQDVLFIRRRYPCHTSNNDKHSSKKVSHKARSSGVNVILNER